MWTIMDLVRNFFTHKDFLPSAEQLPGTLFTPLHFFASALWIALIVLICILLRKKGEKTLQKVFTGLWLSVLVLEVVKITWETCCGAAVEFEWSGNLPLYPAAPLCMPCPLPYGARGRSATQAVAMYAAWVCWAVLSILFTRPIF